LKDRRETVEENNEIIKKGPGRPPTRRSEERKEERKKRVPLGGYRSKLAIPENLVDRTRYVPRWINDIPGRINQARDGAYTHVEDPETGEQIKAIVGRDESGQPITAYLMQIDKDFYEEDFQEKQKEVDKIDEAIYKGRVSEQPGDMRYIPSEGIKYETTKK